MQLCLACLRINLNVRKRDSVEERKLRGFCGILKRQKSLGFGNILSLFSFQEKIIYQVQEMEVDI